MIIEYMYDIIIIGGGIAGLYCAYKIKKHKPSKSILLLEANDHLGGRAGNVDFHSNPIPIGAGIGRKKKDKLLINLLKELKIPYHEFTASSQYATTIEPRCRVKEMFLYLKTNYDNEKDQNKTFIEYAKPLLEKKYGRSSYQNFTVCAGYTDYEKECAYDTLYHYGFDDNYSDFTGMGFSWNQMIKEMSVKIGAANIHVSSYVNSIKKIGQEVEVLTGKEKYLTKQLIIATTIESVRKLLPNKPIFNQIKSQPFLRIYGKFSNSSIGIMKEKCLKTTVIPGPLHKIIPMNTDAGIYMIAYSDNKGAITLEKYKENTSKNRNVLSRLLETALDIPSNTLVLEDMIDFYWDAGTHYYTPMKGNYKNRKEFCKIAQNPEENIMVVGEMISMKQGWVEGALESVESINEKLKN